MDKLSKGQRSRLMARIHSGNRLEVSVHGTLKSLHVRHEMFPEMFGHPDILLERGKGTVVFVNGCFWHGCKQHYREPKTNRVFWREKVRRNRARQRCVLAAYRASGRRVVVVWEHSLRGNVRDTIRRLLGRLPQ